MSDIDTNEMRRRFRLEGKWVMGSDLEFHYKQALDEIDDLRARLAAVEALCDDTDRHPEPNAGMLHTSQVRAALRGEGDRPAEPWPDEDAARFLAHERAQRGGEGDRE